MICYDCAFIGNGGDGAFFEGPEDMDDDDSVKQRARVKRAQKCDCSIIQESKIVGNQEYDIAYEVNGLVQLIGRNEIEDNKLGECKGAAGPAKRAHVSSNVVGTNDETSRQMLLLAVAHHPQFWARMKMRTRNSKENLKKHQKCHLRKQQTRHDSVYVAKWRPNKLRCLMTSGKSTRSMEVMRCVSPNTLNKDEAGGKHAS